MMRSALDAIASDADRAMVEVAMKHLAEAEPSLSTAASSWMLGAEVSTETHVWAAVGIFLFLLDELPGAAASGRTLGKKKLREALREMMADAVSGKGIKLTREAAEIVASMLPSGSELYDVAADKIRRLTRAVIANRLATALKKSVTASEGLFKGRDVEHMIPIELLQYARLAEAAADMVFDSKYWRILKPGVAEAGKTLDDFILIHRDKVTKWMRVELRKLADWAAAASRVIDEATGLDEAAKAAKQAELNKEIRRRLEKLAKQKDKMWGEIWETIEELIDRLNKSRKESGSRELRPGHRTAQTKTPDDSEFGTWTAACICECPPVTPG